MYLHLSKKRKIRTSGIIGVFDMDTATQSRDSREFLSSMQKSGAVVSEVGDIPKSFVLFEEEKIVKAKPQKELKIALLKFSSSSVEKKINSFNEYLK